MEIFLDKKPVGKGHAPYFIASINKQHRLCIEQARALIRMAKKSGADAVELEAYTADTVTLPVYEDTFKVNIDGRESFLYDYCKSEYTPWEWYEDLVLTVKTEELSIVGVPSNEVSVDFLEEMAKPAFYKITAWNLVHIPLLKKVAACHKPVLLEFNFATSEEIQTALAIFQEEECPVILMNVASENEACLKNFETARSFNCLFGLVDNFADDSLSLCAVTLGACVVEKQITLFSEAPKALSMEQFSALISKCNKIFSALSVPRKLNESMRHLRRSIYVSKPIQKGEVFSEKNLKIICPGYGLPPSHWESILGKCSNKDLAFGHPLSLQDIA